MRTEQLMFDLILNTALKDERILLEYDQNVTAHLRHMRRLPKTAAEMYI